MRRAAALAACIAALYAVGCGDNEPATPAACLTGAHAYLGALRAAPGEVRLAGRTPISSCLVENQTAGELSRVGLAMVKTATALNAAARRAPGGQSNFALGYLVGAVEHGAEDTNGVHADLVRRIEAAAEFSPGGRPQPTAFRAALGVGEQAGRARG